MQLFNWRRRFGFDYNARRNTTPAPYLYPIILPAERGYVTKKKKRYQGKRISKRQLWVRPIEWLKLNFVSCMVQKIEKRQLWVRPIEWLKLNFASCVMPYTTKLLVWYWSLWPPMRYDAVARIRVQTSTAFPVIVVAPGTVRPKHGSLKTVQLQYWRLWLGM